jgi:hypothetical protein
VWTPVLGCVPWWVVVVEFERGYHGPVNFEDCDCEFWNEDG